MFRIVNSIVILLWSIPAVAHDTWIETNTNIIRTGDAVYLNLCLGNHGNDHRDFKLAGKLELTGCTLSVKDPDGMDYDLVDRLTDTGYAPKEGFWRCKFASTKPGLYLASHTRDKLVNHGRPLRSIKSAKAFFVVSTSLDQVSRDLTGHDRVLGHPLELIATTNPALPMGPGQEINIQVLFRAKPLAKARVTFVPRSETLQSGFDDRYERLTNADGLASFTPNTGDQYLIVVHHETTESGDGFEGTSYSATLTVFVPESCPCCDE